MGCATKWNVDGKGVPCQFSSETIFYPCNEISFCRFHLPMTNLLGEPTEKTEWIEGGKLKNFNQDIFESIIKTKQDGGFADFHQVVFPGNIIFTNLSQKLGELPALSFAHAQFNGDAEFGLVTFLKVVTFSGASFLKKAKFDSVTFKGSVNFDGTRFNEVPDFRRSKFDMHVTLHKMRVSEKLNKNDRFLGFHCLKTGKENEADKLRRLKELAIISRDHDREQKFFAMELKAKRFYETTGIALLGSYLYEWLSDFGRSILRPVWGISLTWYLSGLLFATYHSQHPVLEISKGFITSASMLFPFLAVSRATSPSQLEGLVAFLGFVEGGLGLLFLFLIGLALRNRFRI